MINLSKAKSKIIDRIYPFPVAYVHSEEIFTEAEFFLVKGWVH
jgi:hypothetical protein